MLYIVVIVCVFKFMYYVIIVFMMQQLKTMSVLIHPNSYQLDIPEKYFMGVASKKGSCFVPQYNIDTTLPQQDSMQRLSRMIEVMSDIYEFKLKHEPEQVYILHKSCVLEFF